MDSLLNQLITVGVCAGVMCLCYLVWLSSGAFSVHYNSERTWSWKIFREDFLKMLLHGFSMVGYVAAANLLSWLFSRFGMDVSILADGASTVLILKRMMTASLDYMAKANNNYEKFFKERHGNIPLLDINPESVDYNGVAKDTEETLGALLSSINTQHDSAGVEAGTTLTKKKVSELAEMGAIPYYKVDVSTPAKAERNLIGKSFDEGFGKQCVAGFKEFMFSLCGRYVAAGGAASGYASDPARSAVCKLGFTWHEGSAGLQDGDWGIWKNGLYGHVAMYYQGKWLGQNQGATDGNAGNAFNLMALPMQGFAGYFRPNIYSKATVKPETEVSSSTIKSGDGTDINIGTRVKVLKSVDVNGTKLMNLQSTPYLVTQVNPNNRTAVLQSDDGDIYARISFENIKKV